ncbi:MAG: NADH-quinone oxidoreductase subunit H, partial [Gammaproteobacteria bacterium]|nr:NADH-quinone oxidoreductase subunit H [Gammaproteobacteria bacterium]
MLFREILMPVLVSAVVLITMAYLTYAERRILGSMQFRHGPNRVGPAGLLQPIADAIKLIFKQHMTPKNANGYLFIFAPIFAFFISMIVWAFIPVGISGAYILNELSLLWIMMISACHVYGLLLAGWASNSKYALLGALRASAQVLSYELALSLIFLTLVILSGSLDLNQITLLQQSPERMCIEWNGVKYPPLLVLYCICIIAETHRAPFDIAEGESELVAGYHVEYGSWGFALFFLAEYIQMIVAS